MYLDPEDQETIIQYLSDGKDNFKDLKPIKQLGKMKAKLLKKYDSSFHEDIWVQYYNACKLAIAEDISRNTGLATDGIMYILDCMGLEKFKEYMSMSQHKPSTTKKSGNGSQRK